MSTAGPVRSRIRLSQMMEARSPGRVGQDPAGLHAQEA